VHVYIYINNLYKIYIYTIYVQLTMSIVYKNHYGSQPEDSLTKKDETCGCHDCLIISQLYLQNGSCVRLQHYKYCINY